MKSNALTAALVIIIVAALGRLIWYYASRPEPGATVPHRMPVACAACGRSWAATVGDQPAKCRFCGAQAAWRAVQCREPDCGAVFPLVRDPSGAPTAGAGRCPKCGGRRVGEVRADAVSEP